MTREQIITLAVSQIGTKEIGTTNDNKYGLWFGFNKVAWCAIFISWVFGQLGKTLKGGGWDKGYASVPLLLEKFRGQITVDPVVADINIFDWDKKGGPDHIGFFITWIDRRDGSFLSLEGNTGPHDPSNGGEVMIVVRNIKDVTAFISSTSFL